MNFSEVVAAAIRDFAEHGYDDEQRLEHWLRQIRAAAEAQATSRKRMEDMLRDALHAIYARLVEREGVLNTMPGVGRFTLHKVAPRLRAEFDKRIMASANLIRLNRDEAIEKTLRRFSGWATSLPKGGSASPEMRKAGDDVKKAMKSLPFVERRVLTDQGHKLAAAISEVVAVGGGAIAGVWFSHWRQANYDYREDHKERDGKVYLVRGSWAQEGGLVKPGEAGFTDQITQPGEEPYCRCRLVWKFNLRELPSEMLTEKGRAELKRVSAVTRAA